jgi:hypothetical protein
MIFTYERTGEQSFFMVPYLSAHHFARQALMHLAVGIGWHILPYIYPVTTA